MSYTVWIAVSPAGVDRINTFVAQIDHAAELSGYEARFFFHLARCCGGEILVGFLRASDGLPETSEVRAFDEQRLSVIGEEDDED